MKILKKPVLPIGFRAGGTSCCIKKSGKKDLALIYSDKIATAAGVFTTNKLQAAPVKVNKIYLSDNRAQAVIVNSGNANCMTKTRGFRDAIKMTSVVAKNLKIKTKNVLVASTGIIGKPLPMDKIKKGIPELVKKTKRSGISDAASAIMTTDRNPKSIALKIMIDSKAVTICGIAKGAGMIYPNMATMLSFITTDAAIAASALKKALKVAVYNSFNCITVDGCMSTNDMVLIMANGYAQNRKINATDKAFDRFSKAINYVCLELAKKIIYDAEGATKFIQIKVKGAKISQDAKKAAFAVANSNLLKTAVFGENRNLGRIYSALGQTGININENRIKVSTTSFKNKNIKITINLNMGKSESTVYTSDLSTGYVRINARYN
ncbi:MAG: bifunctional glutamate N-acetyltransferase/amino-acid acetyltransferase ArgJ [Candidatus Omnitrophota bacterium]